MLIHPFFRLPLLRITDVIMDYILFGQPAAGTSRQGTSQVYYGLQYLYCLRVLFGRWKQSNNRKDHVRLDCQKRARYEYLGLENFKALIAKVLKDKRYSCRWIGPQVKVDPQSLGRDSVLECGIPFEQV